MMNFDSGIAHIVYASDDRFAEILGVSLVSLYENSRDMEEIAVYIFESGISEANKEKLLNVCRDYGRKEIVFIPAKNISKKLSMKVAVDRGSLSQYARLFVSTDLPRDLSRVLYLDCDIIIKQSIRKLWNLDLHGKTIGALMDAFSKYYRANIGLEENDMMFNSGVMLIDLKQWREKNIEEKLMKFIADKKGKIQQGDQGALNAVLSRDTYCFEPRFNSVTIFYDFTYREMLIYRKPPVYYTDEQVKEAVENPAIIHFTTSFLSKRPWMEGCKHRYVGEWLKYKEISPWKERKLWSDCRPARKLMISDVYNVLPKWLAVRIAGVAQSYIRPVVKKIEA